MNQDKKTTSSGRFIKAILKVIFLILLFFGLFGIFSGRMFENQYGSPVLNLIVTIIFPIFYLWPDIIKLIGKRDKNSKQNDS